MASGTRLAIGVLVVLAATTYWACVAASSSWQYYLTVDECMADPSEWRGSQLRVSGSIAAGSLQIDDNHSGASFQLVGQDQTLAVRCGGPLPDGLMEGRQVVVEGRLDDQGQLQGDRVMTRCASKYSTESPAKYATSSPYGKES